MPAEIVSPGYFVLLGAPMAIGPRVSARRGERTLGAAPVTVLSYGLWQRRFGGDPGDRRTHASRSTAARSPSSASLREAFKGTNAIGGRQLWLPFAMYRETTSGFTLDNWDSRRALLFQMTGRLKPGVTRRTGERQPQHDCRARWRRNIPTTIAAAA